MVYRRYSHWTMFVLGGICFVTLGLINELKPWNMPLYQQIILGNVIATSLEFITGYLINICLDWEIWDYSSLRGNAMGQICPLFSLLWLPVCLVGIVLDD